MVNVEVTCGPAPVSAAAPAGQVFGLLDIPHVNPKTEEGRRLRKRLFTGALDHYGAKCSCCGETEVCFLTIEHLENDGMAHRKKFNGGW